MGAGVAGCPFYGGWWSNDFAPQFHRRIVDRHLVLRLNEDGVNGILAGACDSPGFDSSSSSREARPVDSSSIGCRRGGGWYSGVSDPRDFVLRLPRGSRLNVLLCYHP